MKTIPFETLLGKTFVSVDIQNHSEEAEFATETEKFRLYHEQDCCERVYIEDLSGDPNDLVGSPIIQAEESTSHNEREVSESATWTFYRIATVKGQVVIRWIGESNGYYSESVSFVQL